MPQERTHGVELTADPNARLAVVLSMWGPFLTATAKFNSEIQEGLGTLASEWQKFLGCRLEKDFALMRRLTQRPTPDQAWAAYVEFWQKAMEDYSNEYLLIGRLAAGVTTKSLAAAQCATQEVSMDMLPLPKAA